MKNSLSVLALCLIPLFTLSCRESEDWSETEKTDLLLSSEKKKDKDKDKPKDVPKDRDNW